MSTLRVRWDGQSQNLELDLSDLHVTLGQQDLLSYPCIDQPPLPTGLGFQPGQSRVFLELWLLDITDQPRDGSGLFQKQNYFPAPGHIFTVSVSFQNERGEHQRARCCLVLVTWLYFMVWGFGLAFTS